MFIPLTLIVPMNWLSHYWTLQSMMLITYCMLCVAVLKLAWSHPAHILCHCNTLPVVSSWQGGRRGTREVSTAAARCQVCSLWLIVSSHLSVWCSVDSVGSLGLFDAVCCHMDTAIKNPVPDCRVKPSFVHAGAQGWVSDCPDVKNYKWWLNR